MKSGPLHWLRPRFHDSFIMTFMVIYIPEFLKAGCSSLSRLPISYIYIYTNTTHNTKHKTHTHIYICKINIPPSPLRNLSLFHFHSTPRATYYYYPQPLPTPISYLLSPIPPRQSVSVLRRALVSSLVAFCFCFGTCGPATPRRGYWGNWGFFCSAFCVLLPPVPRILWCVVCVFCVLRALSSSRSSQDGANTFCFLLLLLLLLSLG
jgi:hypothetical protein